MSKVNNGNDELIAVLTRIAVALESLVKPVPVVLKLSANDVKKATPPVSEPEKEAAALPLTYEKDIKPIAQRVLVEKGREALLHLLEGFQVKSATKLNADQFDRFIETANKVLA